MSGGPARGVKVANKVEFPSVIAFGKVALMEPVTKVAGLTTLCTNYSSFTSFARHLLL